MAHIGGRRSRSVGFGKRRRNRVHKKNFKDDMDLTELEQGRVKKTTQAINDDLTHRLIVHGQELYDIAGIDLVAASEEKIILNDKILDDFNVVEEKILIDLLDSDTNLADINMGTVHELSQMINNAMEFKKITKDIEEDKKIVEKNYADIIIPKLDATNVLNRKVEAYNEIAGRIEKFNEGIVKEVKRKQILLEDKLKQADEFQKRIEEGLNRIKDINTKIFKI
uniref:Uncharacterized protein n=1 Tax=Parastrongyloides trichosuri TaxID=131310 RepID=A0A0N4ZV34_PARTI